MGAGAGAGHARMSTELITMQMRRALSDRSNAKSVAESSISKNPKLRAAGRWENFPRNTALRSATNRHGKLPLSPLWDHLRARDAVRCFTSQTRASSLKSLRVDSSQNSAHGYVTKPLGGRGRRAERGYVKFSLHTTTPSKTTQNASQRISSCPSSAALRQTARGQNDRHEALH